MTEQSSGFIISMDMTTKKTSGKAPKQKKKRDAATHPPRKNYRVSKATSTEELVSCTYTPRTSLKKSKTEDFICSSSAHAELFAEHATKIHGRWRLSSLRYTLKKYAAPEGYELLLKARQRAIKQKDYRKKMSAEKARIRRAQEADILRRKLALENV